MRSTAFANAAFQVGSCGSHVLTRRGTCRKAAARTMKACLSLIDISLFDTIDGVAICLQTRGFSGPTFGRVQLGQVAIYCRVSTEDQSCQRQERDLRAFAKRAGHEIVAVFKETASGAKHDRAQRKKVMALAQAREIDAI